LSRCRTWSRLFFIFAYLLVMLIYTSVVNCFACELSFTLLPGKYFHLVCSHVRSAVAYLYAWYPYQYNTLRYLLPYLQTTTLQISPTINANYPTYTILLEQYSNALQPTGIALKAIPQTKYSSTKVKQDSKTGKK
jgi:hypothetical protein